MSIEFSRNTSIGIERATYDAGLRAHFAKVFSTMAFGLGITGAVAFFFASVPALAGLVKSFGLILAFAPLIFLMFGFNAARLSSAQLYSRFLTFSGLMGVSMATIFMVYPVADISRVFFITAGTFGCMALWGYSTRRDLTAFGAFLMMGVIGLIIASIANIFVESSALQWAVSVIGVFIFAGLTAFDVQNQKRIYDSAYGTEANSKLAIMGALSLYLNFINMFQFLLSLLGNRE